jgi:hypothetical protein
VSWGRLALLAFSLWLLWQGAKDPYPPEPFTWTGLAVKTFFIIFFYVLLTPLFEVFP